MLLVSPKPHWSFSKPLTTDTNNDMYHLTMGHTMARGYPEFPEHFSESLTMDHHYDSYNYDDLEGALPWLEEVSGSHTFRRELKGDLLALTQIMKSHDISISNFEERKNTLASQIEPGINVDVRGPLMEAVATNPECVRCYGDRITRSGKPTHVREESVDVEDIDQDYGAMLFEESLEAILLNYDGEGIEGFEKVCHTLQD
ncbi:hypothetical protein HAX54_022896 [Datura stramonium]|uniref:Uncharacterized protein n=1 Tax=Datura stramonium TaxID=4076 RepID=A0ABS8S4D5_DATST|nr:hypothetical protein [Datura stramonium]